MGTISQAGNQPKHTTQHTCTMEHNTSCLCVWLSLVKAVQPRVRVELECLTVENYPNHTG